ncbi:hypothetical protein N7468_007792 [Penicillium chermesinum]|uniref:MATH and UCH domain protein n=1 Tax=Penicillium chermesinum TaxID=63820 RepID=A0A9W9TJ84_9EURO|nr:uncharacterized protein N7468_007792 [Penicillium chermesinum]KAJ5223250.1 hypothetical protein N7468_007792 [Penicillium chermesinum]
MESERDSSPNTQSASEVGPENDANTLSGVSVPGATNAPETQTSEAVQDAVQPPSAPVPNSASDTEHAYWAEFEEDTTLPDEEELKEIEGADADYSACDHTYWENNFFRDLEDPEYVPKEKARITWTIKGVRGTPNAPNRAKIMRSPPAYVGGYWWRIKFYPRGNNVGSLSIYLECSPTMPAPDDQIPETEFTVRRGDADVVLNDCAPDARIKTSATTDSAAWLESFKSQYPAAVSTTSRSADSGSAQWRVPAQIGVIVYNPEEPRTGWMQSSCHQFNPHNLDWGWTYFHGPWDQIHTRRRGQHRALLNNDTLSFDAYIRVINHSADVAGLASWLHIAPFCKIIQGVDVLEHLTNCDVKPRPLWDALQKLLWHLRSRAQSLQYVDTDSITSTLRNLREFSSDVSEFWERLRRTLEIELAGTEAGAEFAKLFDSPAPASLSTTAGEVINTLPTEFNSRVCIQADQFQSTGEAMEAYLKAKTGRWTLPPVMHLELRRHTLDKGMRWQLMFNKVNLDERLDLTPWVVDGQDGKYVLYGYIVHRGRRTSGKFFSILRPAGPGTRWLAFDDGSDNRVESLTEKTALGPHLGLDPSQPVDHKKGHDVPVVAIYVRSDMVSELLPGPQGPWDIPRSLKQYYETGVFTADSVASKSASEDVQVEVYSLSDHKSLSSLFDTYDLMSRAKADNSVMYMTLPQSSRLTDLRKKVALWQSVGHDTIGAERVRLWHIGNSRTQCGSTLALDLITDLNVPLNASTGVSRFWMEIISEDDAKFFAIPDPPCTRAIEDKTEESIVERPISGSNQASLSMTDGDAVASSSVTSRGDGLFDRPEVNIIATESSSPPLATASPESDAINDSSQASNNSSPEVIEPEVKLPVGHTYYFIQVFDADKQELQTVGSFFSKHEANVKSSLRRHLQWPIRRDFLMWKRVDGTTITTVSPAESFKDVVVPHGSCLIVGDKLSKDKRTELGISGLFSSPDRLVQYLWAESRSHPIQGFTGTKTVEATFTSDFYSGEFLKGYYHGRGKHLSGTGAVYEGDFVFGKRHGQGKWNTPRVTYMMKTGNKYVGGYKDGKRHGKGISYWEVVDDEMDLCQICYSEEQDAVFCDCGHVCSCVTCAKQVDLCPICRKSIKSVIKIYRT